MTLYNAILTVHIIAGTVSVGAALVATYSKVRNTGHRLHIYSGQTFFWGMLIIFVTAIAMSLLDINIFLFAVAIFSFYMALSGLRYAKNRQGTPKLFDYAISSTMLLTGVAMIIYGALRWQATGGFTVVLMIFGLLGGLDALKDLRLYRQGGLTGKARIAEHLSRMLGGTIATITAVVVTNFYFAPAPWLLWLLPAVLIAPIITIWTRRVRGGVQLKGMRPSP